MLTVYASQRRLPEHHARLASSWWPAFAGRDFTRRAPSKGFQSHHGLPPFPSLLGARTILPSGPRSAIASFGSSEGHSLVSGPPGFGPWAKRLRETCNTLRARARGREVRTLCRGGQVGPPSAQRAASDGPCGGELGLRRRFHRGRPRRGPPSLYARA